MCYLRSIQQFVPVNEQETADQKLILSYVEQHAHNVLLRDNAIAHITCSGFIMNKHLNRVLLVHHNIRNTWAWTGGHADGDGNLLDVAIKEAREETGVVQVQPLSQEIASLDILPVFSHWRRGRFVNAHLHLSVAYLLICDEQDPVRPCASENTKVAWFDTDFINRQNFDASDVSLYSKLISRARQWYAPSGSPSA